MKKILLAILGLSNSFYVFSESPQLQYIKGMYELSVYLESNDKNSFNPDYYLEYFDNYINKIYARDRKYGEKIDNRDTTGCMNHDGVSVLWQVWSGQKIDPKAKLTFSEPQKNRVKVTIGATKGLEERSVIYQVKCKQGNSCKITEIFEYGKPFTKVVTKCLDIFKNVL